MSEMPRQEAKHTPGPWYVGDRNPADNTLPIYDNNRRVCAIADVKPQPHYEDTQEEHARLIAAAPELLAALQRFVGFKGTYGGGEKMDHIDYKLNIEHMQRGARAAIAKAANSR